MPTSFSHIVLCLLLFRCYCYNHYKTQKYYFCYHYRYFHTTLLLNNLLQILSYPGVVELTTQLLILENILWLLLCRINKFGLNTLPSKTVAIPYTCGLSTCIDVTLYDEPFCHLHNRETYPYSTKDNFERCPVIYS